VLAAYPAVRPDVLVVAGDITGRLGNEPIYTALDRLPFPVLAVHGNTDTDNLEEVAKRYRNITPLHLRAEIVAGVTFFGLGGALSVPFLEKLHPRDDPHLAAAAAILGEETVLVTHTPPWGILDRGFAALHGGSQGLRKLIAKRQPRLHICGHIHEDRGTAAVGKTTVVNCSMGRQGTGAVIDIKKRHRSGDHLSLMSPEKVVL